VVSPETVVWCAKHRYPYVALATFLEPTIEMLNLYADVAAQEGYQAGPENFGYLQRVIVAETEEKAQELGKGFMYGGGIFTFARPEWAYPAGYNSKAATRRLARVFTDPKTGQQLRRVTPSESAEDIEETRRHIYASYQAELDNQQIIVGTPKTVIAKLRKFIEVLRPGIFALWYAHGPSSHEDRMTSLRLLGQEVLPAMREMAHELDLVDPYERKPGSRPLPPSGVREPVVGQTAVAS
jgi:alkanesulfonate monooxygenase SsuD/methylene tetrahydromethanopterin reductase-like flavin-dependent oxidoreductase (luciferase family)